MSVRISEDRRKKLQDLEKELQETRKKLQEMQKLEKLKLQSDQNIRNLREEILVGNLSFLSTLLAPV